MATVIVTSQPENTAAPENQPIPIISNTAFENPTFESPPELIVVDLEANPQAIGVAQGEKKDTYVGFVYCSICCGIFCFLPTGLIAAYLAHKANIYQSAGKKQTAERYNKYAIWLIIATITIGLIIYANVLFLVILEGKYYISIRR